MRRFHLIELEDLAWCSTLLRNFATDYLQHIFTLVRPYSVVLPELLRCLAACDVQRIVDLGSGAGGPWMHLFDTVRSERPTLTVLLTDKHPNEGAANELGMGGHEGLTYHPQSIDALEGSPALPGFKTLFTALHHFRPVDAARILADAVEKKEGIAVFEVTDRSWTTLLTVLVSPLLVLLLTPWIKPFRWPRLILTYVVPAVPLFVVFDGIVSVLRSYTVEELKDLARGVADSDKYEWRSGRLPVPNLPVAVTFLTGVPLKF